MIKEATPVADSDWVQFIANHDLRSPLIIAHTRRATRGTPSYQNAQPFTRELAGRVHLFAHNGDLPGIFASTEFQSQAIQPGRRNGLRARLLCSPRPDGVDLDGAKYNANAARKILIVSSFAGELRALGPANFLYSDGDVLFAHGHRRKHADTGKIEAPGLVSLQRQCQQGGIGFAASGHFHPWRPSARDSLRERASDERTLEPACRRRTVAVSGGQACCTAIG